MTYRLALLCACLCLPAAAAPLTPATLAPQLLVGDLVFIRVGARPFREVAAATGSWTNHVGVVVDAGEDPVIAESTFPFSRKTTLTRFAARSEGGRMAVLRLNAALTGLQQAALRDAAEARLGIFYDTGFDLHSRRQFCSRFAREVLAHGTGIVVGEEEHFGELLERHPQANVGFWKLWYFGSIPWQRTTVTPASLLASPALHPVFDGAVLSAASRSPGSPG